MDNRKNITEALESVEAPRAHKDYIQKVLFAIHARENVLSPSLRAELASAAIEDDGSADEV